MRCGAERGRSVAACRLEQNAFGSAIDGFQLISDEKPLLLVANHQQRRRFFSPFESVQPQDGFLKQGVLSGKPQKLFGIFAA